MLTQATGPENIGHERPPSGLKAGRPVLSPSHITPENNEKIRPQPDRENAFAGASGGSIGIRTLETVPRLHTFQACAFDHSATDPLGLSNLDAGPIARGSSGQNRGTMTGKGRSRLARLIR